MKWKVKSEKRAIRNEVSNNQIFILHQSRTLLAHGQREAL